MNHTAQRPGPRFGRLVKGDWWLPATTVTSDDEGRIVVEGFAGEYRVRVGGAEALVALDEPGVAERRITLDD